MKRVVIAVMAALALGIAGCGSTPDDGSSTAGRGGIGPGGMDGGTLGRPGGSEGSLYGAGGAGGSGGAGGAGSATDSDHRIYFELDSSLVSDASRSTLNRNADMAKSKGGTITVEGHADERGTREYNLALAQQRADSVKQYLIMQGVDSSKIKTISYGKERPLVSSHDEFAWSKNRRAELLIQ